jgi:hypothetical protein
MKCPICGHDNIPGNNCACWVDKVFEKDVTEEKYSKPWSLEGLRSLLRFGRKSSGAWDDVDDGYMPDDDDAEYIIQCIHAFSGLDMSKVPAGAVKRLVDAVSATQANELCDCPICTELWEALAPFVKR